MISWSSMILRSAIDPLAALLFPAPCRICRAVLLNASRIPTCPACLASSEPIPSPVCGRCGKPFLAPDGAESVQPRCRLCREDFFAFDFARSYAVYSDALHHAILLLKYEEVTRRGDWFAARLAEVVSREAEAFRADAVVPVPLHPDRQRERGYNQSERIARPWARRLYRKQRAYRLMRTKPRPARVALSRKEHWDSVRGAYATRKGLRVDKLRVLLVDDVMTTGATLDACARALKSAGASYVLGLTVARVVTGRPPSAGAQSREARKVETNEEGADSILTS